MQTHVCRPRYLLNPPLCTNKAWQTFVIAPWAVCRVCLIFKIFPLPLYIFLSTRSRKIVYAINQIKLSGEKSCETDFSVLSSHSFRNSKAHRISPPISSLPFPPPMKLERQWPIFINGTRLLSWHTVACTASFRKALWDHDNACETQESAEVGILFTLTFHLHIHILLFNVHLLWGEQINDWKKTSLKWSLKHFLCHTMFQMEAGSPKAVRLNTNSDSYGVSSLLWANPASLFQCPCTCKLESARPTPLQVINTATKGDPATFPTDHLQLPVHG